MQPTFDTKPLTFSNALVLVQSDGERYRKGGRGQTHTPSQRKKYSPRKRNQKVNAQTLPENMRVWTTKAMW